MSTKEKEEEQSLFGLLDIFRILGGLLFLNAFFSWWFTSTSTWGYQGRWIDSRYLRLRLTNNYVNLTLDELALYNGTDASLPIYVAINGKVYDVSNSRETYGPGGTYGFFSGKDAARAFHTGCFRKPDEFTYDLRGLDMEEALVDIKSWQSYYEKSNRYWFAGVVQHLPLSGEPPAPCEHMKFPGHI